MRNYSRVSQFTDREDRGVVVVPWFGSRVAPSRRASLLRFLPHSLLVFPLPPLMILEKEARGNGKQNFSAINAHSGV